MAFLRTHKWTLVSLFLSAASWTALYATTSYFYRRGGWNPDSVSAHRMMVGYSLAMVLSFTTSIAGMARDRHMWLGVVALIMSCLGLLVAMTG